MNNSNPEEHVGYLLFEVSRLFRRRFEEEAKTSSITLQQSRVISYLCRHPEGLSQTALASAMDINPMTMSGILERLEKRDFVQRKTCPNDSRAKLVKLTKEGCAMASSVRNLGRDLYDNALADLTKEQRKTLIESLSHIRDQLSDIPPEQKEPHQ